MSLDQRLRRMEDRIAELESFMGKVLAAMDDEQADDQETVTLDGERDGGARDQTESLG